MIFINVLMKLKVQYKVKYLYLTNTQHHLNNL